MRLDSSPVRSPAAPVAPLAVALCATFTHGFVQAAPIAVDINPDMTLGTYNLAINGSPTLFSFFFQSRNYTCPPPNDPCQVSENLVNMLGNAVVGTVNASAPAQQTGAYVTALNAGELIGASSGFLTNDPALLSGKDEGDPYGEFFGNLMNPELLYVGLRFDLAGATHFGWVEIDADPFLAELTLTRFGYENTPDTAIAAGAGVSAVPEPGTLALLAAGAAGVLALRRRRVRIEVDVPSARH